MAREQSWRDKFHPVCFELAALNRWMEEEFSRLQRECVKRKKNLGDQPDQKADGVAAYYYEGAAKLSSEFDRKLVEINQRYPDLSYNSLAYSYFDLASGEPADNLVPYLHWMRHRESLQATTTQDAQGNIKAWRKIARTAEDYRRIRHKKGPIKPFQGDTVHRQLLELMLCFELKPLTAEERADCADAYCACKKIHDADALKKQFGRLRRELEDSAEWAAPSFAQPPKEPKVGVGRPRRLAKRPQRRYNR
jgi:hypothetical protein